MQVTASMGLRNALHGHIPASWCLTQNASTTFSNKTCLEALVTRDKLKEVGGEARWVSSERQYADGLTKDSATQLLADRLRTHNIRLLRMTPTRPVERRKHQSERKVRTCLRGPRLLRLLSPPQLFRLGPRASPRTSPRPLFCTR